MPHTHGTPDQRLLVADAADASAADAGSGCPTEHVFPTIDFGCQARGSVTLLPLPETEAGTFSDPTFRVTPMGVEFAPLEERDFSASIPLVRDGCVVGQQPVIGTGVDAVLRWSPPVVDFGYVKPGRTGRERVTFMTCSTMPIALINLRTIEGSSSASVFGVDAGAIVVPGAVRAADGTRLLGELEVELTFTPAVLGPRQGQLVAQTQLEPQPMLSIALRAVGGGPVVGVSPLQLDFGAVTSPTSQVVTVSNTGAPADPRANLFLGLGGLPPYFELTPGDCGTVTLSSYDPNVGLTAGQSVSFTVELEPATAPRTCTLRIFTTDPESPVTQVTITAQ
jgi:hypothetical protein